VTAKDVHNIKTKVRQTAKGDDQVRAVTDLLKAVPGSFLDIEHSESGTIRTVCFQTPYMRKMFSLYGDTLIFDATYKVSNCNMPLYLPLVVDSNGRSQIVCVFLSCNEEAETLSLLMHSFSRNNNCETVQCLMVDKDLSAVNVLGTTFINASINLCLFHCLRTFRREITEAKLGITTAQKSSVLELISDMVYASTEAHYDTAYQSLQQLQLPQVMQYFDPNWHGCRAMWVPCMKNNCLNLGITGTQRIESLHQKVKDVVKRNSEMVSFVTNLITFLRSNEHESQHAVLDSMHRRPVKRPRDDDAMHPYFTVLTSYAYSFVAQQYRSSASAVVDANGTATSHEGQFLVTESTCCCSFHNTVKLPCRHILRLRQDRGLPVFDEVLVPVRWKACTWKESNTLQYSDISTVTVTETRANVAKALSAAQKYRQAATVTTEMAQILSTVGTRCFRERLHQLHLLLNTWKEGREVQLIAENAEDAEEQEQEIISEQQEQAVVEEYERTHAGSLQEEVEDAEDADEHGQVLDENEHGRGGFSVEEAVSAESVQDQGVAAVEEEEQAVLQEIETNNQQLHFPAAIKRRGRPKGCDTTVLGLLKRRTGTQAFCHLTIRQKQEAMLTWLCGTEITASSILSYQMEAPPVVELPQQFRDSSVLSSLSLLQNFVDTEHILKKARQHGKKPLICGTCNVPIEGVRSIGCDSCLLWFHFSCARLKRAPTKKMWSCPTCRNKKL
jgi:zinc finger SWIM domain-containing protein 3